MIALDSLCVSFTACIYISRCCKVFCGALDSCCPTNVGRFETIESLKENEEIDLKESAFNVHDIYGATSNT